MISQCIRVNLSSQLLQFALERTWTYKYSFFGATKTRPVNCKKTTKNKLKISRRQKSKKDKFAFSKSFSLQ